MSNNTSRRLKRHFQKKMYDSFSRKWRDIKREQTDEKLTDEQARKRGEVLLGKKPTFKNWIKMVEKFKAYKSSPEEVQEYKDEIQDLEWDED